MKSLHKCDLWAILRQEAVTVFHSFYPKQINAHSSSLHNSYMYLMTVVSQPALWGSGSHCDGTMYKLDSKWEEKGVAIFGESYMKMHGKQISVLVWCKWFEQTAESAALVAPQVFWLENSD